MSNQPEPKPVILTLETGQVIHFLNGQYPNVEDNALKDMLDIIFDGWEPEGYIPTLDFGMAEEAQKWLGGSIEADIESDPNVIY